MRGWVEAVRGTPAAPTQAERRRDGGAAVAPTGRRGGNGRRGLSSSSHLYSALSEDTQKAMGRPSTYCSSCLIVRPREAPATRARKKKKDARRRSKYTPLLLSLSSHVLLNLRAVLALHLHPDHIRHPRLVLEHLHGRRAVHTRSLGNLWVLGNVDLDKVDFTG